MYCLNNLCSLCLAHNKKFTTRSSINLNAEDILQRIIPEFLLPTSKIQRKLCDDCLDTLNSVFEFRRRCLENIITYDEYVGKLQGYGSYKYLSITITDIKKEIDKEVILDEDTCDLEDDLRTDCSRIEDVKQKNSSYRESNEEQDENDHKSDVVLDIKKEINEEIILHPNISFLEYNVRTNFLEMDNIKQEHSYNKDPNEEQDENDQKHDVALDMKKEINEEVILDENISFHEDKVCTNFFQIDGDIKQEHSYNRESNEEQYEDDQKSYVFDIKKEINEEVILEEDTYFLEDDLHTNFLEINIKQEKFHNREPNEEQDEDDQKSDLWRRVSNGCDTGKTDGPGNPDIDGNERLKCTECGEELINRICDIDSPKCQKCDTNNGRNKSKKVNFAKKSHVCNTCHKSFRFISKLKEHESVHTRPFCCDICGQRFAHIRSIKAHKLSHTKTKPFFCGICRKGFATYQNLRRHNLNHSDESFEGDTNKKPYVCGICHKGLTTAQNLQKHNLTHINERSFQCDICQKSFKSADCVKRHKKIHTGIKRFKCGICLRKFLQKYELIRHTMVHTGERPFQCDLCGKKFPCSSDLTRHVKTHSFEKPYECSICKKRFKVAKYLQIHELSHTKKRSFQCNICEQTFISSAILKKHTCFHNKRYICTICKQSFDYLCHLKNHMLIHTEEKQFLCDVCPKKFLRAESLRDHKLIHDGIKPFQCGLCGKSFRTCRERNQHRRNKHEGNFETAQESILGSDI